MIEESTMKLEKNQSLSYEEIIKIMDNILDGKSTDNEIADFLIKLTDKGETNDELLGMLESMQKFGIHIKPNCNRTIIDVCGTGGDSMNTFNVSTAAAFVIAASGGAVAKHGNRSISGVSGSADIFEYFGYDLNATPEQITKIIEKFGIGFMFAQKFHPAMKNVSNARKIVGRRTAFNLLGPLSNPANVKNQLVGVFSDDYLERIIHLLKKRGADNIMSVRSEDGMDELSTTSKNKIYFHKEGKLQTIVLDSEKLGLHKGNLKDIQISTKEEALSAFVSVLDGTANKTMLEITALNAAGGLMVSNLANNFQEGLEIANSSIKNGKTWKLFENFLEFCGDVKKIEGLKRT